jgi:hypothetical protein
LEFLQLTKKRCPTFHIDCCGAFIAGVLGSSVVSI